MGSKWVGSDPKRHDDHCTAGICDAHSYEQIKEKWPETYAARKADKLNFRYPAGESYMDVIKRLESIIIEVERENESICIIGHQAILRCLYAYFKQVPRVEVRIHFQCIFKRPCKAFSASCS